MGQSTGAFYMQNWWALFILLPAIGAFATAWRIFQDAGGRLTYAARGALLAGSILVYTTVIFLLNLSWVMLGPVVIILAGVGMLLNYALPQ
jgi:hypothetical protein